MKNNKPRIYNTPYQLKLPLEIEKIIEISDPVYTFCEVMENIDLRKYLAVKESRTGRKRYSPEILLKIILFAFMENGYVSTREIEKLCKTDIRFMYLLDEHPAPSHMTIDNFMNDVLSVSISDIFNEINGYIFKEENVDVNHVYIHNEVLDNLNSTQGALLRMNRSIQAEGAYGTIKWNRAYTRARRRGIKGLNLEIAMISCGFNLHKYHLKQQIKLKAA